MAYVPQKVKKEKEGGFSFLRLVILVAVFICVCLAYLSKKEAPELIRAKPKPKVIQGTGYTDYVPNGKGGVSIRSEYAGDVKPKGSDK